MRTYPGNQNTDQNIQKGKLQPLLRELAWTRDTDYFFDKETHYERGEFTTALTNLPICRNPTIQYLSVSDKLGQKIPSNRKKLLVDKNCPKIIE